MRRGYVIDGVVYRGGGNSLKGQIAMQRKKEEGALEAEVVMSSGAPEEKDYTPVSPTHAVHTATRTEKYTFND